MRRRDLERLLEQVPPLPRPQPELEQYRTPPPIAAELLLQAHADGAIEGRRVLDLGCGTGTFALGAAALRAREALGVDVDANAVRLAQELALRLGLAFQARFEAHDLREWTPEPEWDTAVMNPPFGAQAGNRHGDRLFLERALQALRPGGTAWFLALERTERFLESWACAQKAAIERVAVWDYPLEATMPFHTKEAQVVRVGGYRLQREDAA